ncbi:hypothetical protein BpHYR1_045979 [Brachionus plicatilis]|uniref:Uncharacterized protein n=1 Tax=Brachionus plicatilis TaxID=10195 RepID=A0A3M7T6U7_BRAPC|nr:hypothetical protein BpHYR1_045979 [Brachionus plicatilis]
MVENIICLLLFVNLVEKERSRREIYTYPKCLCSDLMFTFTLDSYRNINNNKLIIKNFTQHGTALFGPPVSFLFPQKKHKREILSIHIGIAVAFAQSFLIIALISYFKKDLFINEFFSQSLGGKGNLSSSRVSPKNNLKTNYKSNEN